MVKVAHPKSSQQAGVLFQRDTQWGWTETETLITSDCWSLLISLCPDYLYTLVFCLLPTTEQHPSCCFHPSIPSSAFPLVSPPVFHTVLSLSPCQCVSSEPWLYLAMGTCRCQHCSAWYKSRFIKITVLTEMHNNYNHTFSHQVQIWLCFCESQGLGCSNRGSQIHSSYNSAEDKDGFSFGSFGHVPLASLRNSDNQLETTDKGQELREERSLKWVWKVGKASFCWISAIRDLFLICPMKPGVNPWRCRGKKQEVKAA